MLSVQGPAIPSFGGDLPPPSPARTSLAVPPSPRPGESLDKWFEGFQKYETTLQAMAAASEEPKFREELGTIEQWFAMLSDSEQTASLYTLVQHAKPAQLNFLSAVISQLTDAQPEKAPKPKPSRTLRPPNLNLPVSPISPRFNVNAVPSAPPSARLAPRSNGSLEPAPGGAQELLLKPNDENSWANMVPTPMDRMFQKSSPKPPLSSGLNPPGMPLMNVNTYNMMGISNEAQLLAMQMVMSGLVPSPIHQQQAMPSGKPYQPEQQQPRHQPQPQRTQPHKMSPQHGRGGSHSSKTSTGNWRAPSSGKYPGSAFNGRSSSGPKSSGFPKSAGLKSAAPSSAAPTTAGATPKEEDVDPALLEDVPAWLKSLRLHKYTDCFKGMTWRDMITLDEDDLEKRGVVALGARRRMTKTFDIVKRKMGIEEPSQPSGPASALVAPTHGLPPVRDDLVAPHSAAPVFAH